MADIPGNTSTGSVITGTGTFTSTLEFSGDSDWWRVDLIAGRAYDFTLSGDGSATSLDDADFVIRDAAGNAIYSTYTGSGGPLTLDLTAPTSGAYYIQVSDGINDGLAEGSYILRARMNDTIPNDSSTTARLGDGVTAGTLDADGDADRYRVHVNAGQRIEFILSGDGSAQSLDDADFYLLDQNGNSVDYSYTGSGGPISVSATAAITGDYFIVVRDGLNDDGAEGNYRVNARLTDTVVGDNSTTAVLRDGTSLFSRIDAYGDADWTRFAAVAGVTYTFSLSGTGSATSLSNKELTLRDASGSAITYDWESGSTPATITWTATTNGPVYLDAHSGSSSYTGDYKLSVVSTAAQLTGTTGNDTLTAGGNANRVMGLAGDDLLAGGDGNDTLNGGMGNDTLWGGAGSDFADYSAVATGAHVDLSIAGPQATGLGADQLIAIENLLGGSGADVLTGNGVANILLGAAGNDTLNGAAGNDTLNGGAGNDRVIGGAGTDTVVFNTASAMTINLASGVAFGTGQGTDVITGVEIAISGTGNDRMTGGGWGDQLFGGAGYDTLAGGDGDDLLAGGTQNDSLDGGAGNDRFYGQAGDDYLRGGAGADLFIMGAGGGRDHVMDWQDGVDHIQFVGPTAFSQLNIVQWGADVHIQVQGQTWMVVHNQTVNHFTAADFIF